jgi:cell wall-associated NlpC family hydrolase
VSAREVVVRCAREQLGDQYKWATAGPDTFDCSGLTSYCYGQAGMAISRSSYDQATAGRSISRSNAQPGDILIYGNGSHVGLVTGPNEAIHALNENLDIRVTKIDGANIGLPLTDVRSILDNDATRERDRIRRRRRKA